jgi:hypothetical protein
MAVTDSGLRMAATDLGYRVSPPSITTAWPVMNCAWSEARERRGAADPLAGGGDEGGLAGERQRHGGFLRFYGRPKPSGLCCGGECRDGVIAVHAVNDMVGSVRR